MRDGLVEVPARNEWRLTDAGREYVLLLAPELFADTSAIMRRFGHMNGDALIDYVYEAFPWMTVNSQMEHRRAMQRPVAAEAIYTAGYEGFSVDEMLNMLMLNGITRVIDVRNNPHSRKYGFSKSTLEHLSRLVGIGYNHVPELGIPIVSRKRASEQKDYSNLFAEYASKTLADEAQAVKAVSKMMSASASAILCFEANPNYCHRSYLADGLRALGDNWNEKVVHLGWPRSSESNNSNMNPQMF